MNAAQLMKARRAVYTISPLTFTYEKEGQHAKKLSLGVTEHKLPKLWMVCYFWKKFQHAADQSTSQIVSLKAVDHYDSCRTTFM